MAIEKVKSFSRRNFLKSMAALGLLSGSGLILTANKLEDSEPWMITEIHPYFVESKYSNPVALSERLTKDGPWL